MATAVVAMIRGGCISVPVLNTTMKMTRLPTREYLGTWIPCDEEMIILELEGRLQMESVSDWIDSLRKLATEDSTKGEVASIEPIPEIKAGELDDQEKELITKLLKQYSHLTQVPTRCPSLPHVGVEHVINTGTHAPIRLPHQRHAQENRVSSLRMCTKCCETASSRKVMGSGGSRWFSRSRKTGRYGSVSTTEF